MELFIASKEPEKTSMYTSRLISKLQEIRLITILPASSESDIIQCQLETVSLLDTTAQYRAFNSSSENLATKARVLLPRWFKTTTRHKFSEGGALIVPKFPDKEAHRYTWGDFAALSYMWGDKSQLRTVIINDEKVEVRMNLENVLRELRHEGKFGALFKLWVDALCINQSDDIERTEQVAKMDKIYTLAWSIVAWIGPEENDSAKAMALLETLATYWPDRTKLDALRDQLVEQPNHFAKGSWLALKHLSEREYWTRLWIVQELALGASGVILRCGAQSMEWETMGAGLKTVDTLWNVKDICIMSDRKALDRSDDRRWGSAQGLHHISKELRRTSEMQRDDQAPPPLTWLLQVANFSKCFEDKDKVYGMLGIMDPKVACQIPPNYQLTTRQVFINIAKTYIAADQNLELLREANPWGNSEVGAPTWVPDWTWTGRLRDNKFSEPNFLADGGSNPFIEFSEDGSLTCLAVIFDTIDGLGAQGSGMLKFLDDTVVKSKFAESAYGGKDETAAALSCFLHAGHSLGNSKAQAMLHFPSNTRIAVERFKQLGWKQLAIDGGYYSRWSRWRTANRDFVFAGRSFDDYFTERISDAAVLEDFGPVMGNWVRTSLGRRIATTTKGYIAWVPDNRNDTRERQVRSGDLIAIVMGCSTPVVIRPSGRYYEVVGEGYVQGIMYGETIIEVENGSLSLEKITFH
jgi:hypothetical protein